jgi:TetR/AcrR family transcriptional regulator, cholesterol catabolism regulator
MERKKILSKIAKLFKEKGYHHTSIKDISQEVGFEGGALYYHIKSKEAALYEIGENAINQLLGEMEKIHIADLPPKEKLKAAIETQVNFFVDQFYETCVFLIETKALSVEYQRHYLAKRDRYEEIWRKIIRDGMRKGEFRQGNVKLITFAILGMLNWLVVWFKPGKGWSPREIVHEFTKIILKGLES